MGSEMRGHHFGMTDDIVIMYGVLPYGRGSSPSRFVRFSDALTKLQQLSGPEGPSWNLPFAFRPSMFIDDGLFVELTIGDRRRRSVAEWEHLSRGMLSQDAINEGKEREAVEWKEEQIFFGIPDQYLQYDDRGPPRGKESRIHYSPRRDAPAVW